jgi:hypothetical protein
MLGGILIVFISILLLILHLKYRDIGVIEDGTGFHLIISERGLFHTYCIRIIQTFTDEAPTVAYFYSKQEVFLYMIYLKRRMPEHIKDIYGGTNNGKR